MCPKQTRSLEPDLVFASPSADQMLAVARAIDAGEGVLFLYGNYGGDVLNFGLAAELAEAEGIRVATVLAADDVASAPKGGSPASWHRRDLLPLQDRRRPRRGGRSARGSQGGD